MSDDAMKIIVGVVGAAMLIGFLVFMVLKGKKSAEGMSTAADKAVVDAFSDAGSITP